MWKKIKSLKKQMGKNFWWFLACWIVWTFNISLDIAWGKITHLPYLIVDVVAVGLILFFTYMEFKKVGDKK
jgi:hypothetical protein